MDIVTHAMTGTIIASPFFSTAPVTAGCFVLGSVLPDVDSLGRLFGKRAFLRCHQTYTHSLPVILGLTVLLWPLPAWLKINEPWAPATLGAGMLLHALLDTTNTYGVALLRPFGRKRWCTEWVFFIDSITIAVSIGFLLAILVSWYGTEAVAPWLALVYGTFMVLYWTLRWRLHRRAIRLAPAGRLSLIPSAFVPWRFFACREQAESVDIFTLNVLSGTTTTSRNRQTFDARYHSWLDRVPEYRLMRDLSHGYHAIEAAEAETTVEVTCCDLRTRNFGGSFGRLELTFDSDGKVVRKRFHV